MKSPFPQRPGASPPPARSFGVPPVGAPQGLGAWRLDAGGDAFALLEIEIPAADANGPEFVRSLTVAEADVARMMTAGLSNAAIARRRGTAVRTIANQVASIFDKLGVRSRSELCFLAVTGFAPGRKGNS
ncbi:MAG: response regulator transcription factor [Myxococcales bacterium]